MLVNEIINNRLSEGPNDPHIFKAIFLAGGPGSGKGFVVSNLMGADSTGLKVVNSDEVYEKLASLAKPEPLDLSDPEVVASPQGQEAREKAKRLTKMKQTNYLDGRLGLIIDGTAKDVAKTKDQKQKLEQLGYDTMMVFVNTNLEMAQARNKMRPRQLPNEMITKMWHAVQDNMMKFQQMFGNANFYIIDNSGGLEDPDRKENFEAVEKAIRKFINIPPRKPQAKSWFASQQQNRVKSDK
jgi:predicted kinase